MITIVGCNKGGASKSTTATNLAAGLSKAGSTVCLVDADGQRSAAKWHADREAAGVKSSITLVEKTGKIAETLLSLEGSYDHIIVDVPGRNSIELISGSAVAHQIIAPHQCSQFDLDTLEELQIQMVNILKVNKELKIFVYHTVCSTHSIGKLTERAEFLEFLEGFPEFEVLKSISYSRKIYKEALSLGRSVLEIGRGKSEAADEVRALMAEVFTND